MSVCGREWVHTQEGKVRRGANVLSATDRESKKAHTHPSTTFIFLAFTKRSHTLAAEPNGSLRSLDSRYSSS